MKTETAVLNGHVEDCGKPCHKFHLRISAKKMKEEPESFEKIPMLVAGLAYIGFYVLLFLGYLSQLIFPPKVAKEKNREGYPELYSKFEPLYLNYVFRRIKDCWERPLCGVPGDQIVIKDRISPDNGWTYEFTGTETKLLNLGSYNYLGFGQCSGPCATASANAVTKYGCATGSTAKELGNTTLQMQLEKLTARFLGVEEAIVFGMGFATNASTLSAIIHPGCLVISDEKNHASLILGLRLAGSIVKVYRHNDMRSLENELIAAVKYGQPTSGLPWDKIFIVAEGIFSMDGSIVKLPTVLALKKKYKAYLYIDEAHSIGALGPHGRGVTDYYNCNPKDVDILMGSYAKSFGSVGGYIAGSKSLIRHIRENSDAVYYTTAMPPPVAQQIITSMKIIMGEDGTNEGLRRIRRLARNTRYFRKSLCNMGCIVYGHKDSPVVPLLLYSYSKTAAVIRAYTRHNIATVGVGFPATSFLECRIRFCMSAAHSMKQLERVLDITKKIADEMGLRYSQRQRNLSRNLVDIENDYEDSD